MEFEWNENKNIENIKKHKISFEQAVAAFNDPMAIPLEDPEHSDENEIRYALVGLCEIGLIFISFTFTDKNIRLISARNATKTMIKKYENQEF